jgi:hypothetical protein
LAGWLPPQDWMLIGWQLASSADSTGGLPSK